MSLAVIAFVKVWLSVHGMIMRLCGSSMWWVCKGCR